MKPYPFGEIIMKTAIGIGTALVLSASGACAAPDNSRAMNDVVNHFFAAYRTVEVSDGIPDAKARPKYEPFITPALDQLLIQGDQAEARYAKATNYDYPPLLEGDVFTSNFEGATSYAVRACTAGGKTGTCTVDLVYDESKSDNRHAGPPAKPVKWTDTIYLLLTDKGWRIDDIGYGAGFDFGNKGKLRDELKWAIAESKKPQSP